MNIITHEEGKDSSFFSQNGIIYGNVSQILFLNNLLPSGYRLELYDNVIDHIGLNQNRSEANKSIRFNYAKRTVIL